MDAVLHALADPIRRDILRMVRDVAMTAGAIAAAFPVSRPAVSRHLRVLREGGLVHDEIVGRERVYRLEPAALAAVEAYLKELRAQGNNALDAWQHRLMALDTEVHRVRARAKGTGKQSKGDNTRKAG